MEQISVAIKIQSTRARRYVTRLGVVSTGMKLSVVSDTRGPQNTDSAGVNRQDAYCLQVLVRAKTKPEHTLHTHSPQSRATGTLLYNSAIFE